MADVAFFNNSINADTYLWDFGDGSTSTQASPSHVYVQSGAYVVRMTAGRGEVKSHAQRVVVVRGGVAANFLTTSTKSRMTTSAGDQLVVVH